MTLVMTAIGALATTGFHQLVVIFEALPGSLFQCIAELIAEISNGALKLVPDGIEITATACRKEGCSNVVQ